MAASLLLESLMTAKRPQLLNESFRYNTRTVQSPTRRAGLERAAFSSEERISSPRTVRISENEMTKQQQLPLPSSLNALELREHEDSTGLYGIGMKIEIDIPHAVKQVSDLQDEFGNSLNEEVQVGDILILVDNQAVGGMDIDVLERLIFGEKDTVVRITLISRQGGSAKQLRARRHVLVRTIQTCRRCYTVKDGLKGRNLTADPSVVGHLEDIRLSVCDGLGCFLDLMNDDEGSDLPFWNTRWDLARRPSSSLGIIFEQNSENSAGSVRIHGVVAGSPADVMGQLKGQDEILAVDGCLVDSRNVKQKLRGQDVIGTFCNVLIQRGSGNTFEVQLQRTSAAYIFALGQLFDLLSSHELLASEGGSQHEILLSVQAIHFQILSMERVRLRRESCLASRMHNIQAKVFDKTMSVLSLLSGSPGNDVARTERRDGIERSHCASEMLPSEELPTNTSNIFSVRNKNNGVSEQVHSAWISVCTLLQREVLAMQEELGSLIRSMSSQCKELSHTGLDARLYQMREDLKESNRQVLFLTQEMEYSRHDSVNKSKQCAMLNSLEMNLKSKENVIIGLQEESRKYGHAFAQMKLEKKYDQDCLQCATAELRECTNALAKSEYELETCKRRSRKDAVLIEKLKLQTAALEKTLQEFRQEDAERILLLEHECNSLKTKISEADKEHRNMALMNTSHHIKQSEDFESAASACRKQLEEVRLENAKCAEQLQRYEQQMQELLSFIDRKSVIGLEIEKAPPYRVLQVTELMDPAGNLDSDRVCVNDELTGIDGNAITSQSPNNVFQMLSGLPGTLVSLQFRSQLDKKYTFVAQRHVQITSDNLAESMPRRVKLSEVKDGKFTDSSRFTSSYSLINQVESSAGLHKNSPAMSPGTSVDGDNSTAASPRTPAKYLFPSSNHGNTSIHVVSSPRWTELVGSSASTPRSPMSRDQLSPATQKVPEISAKSIGLNGNYGISTTGSSPSGGRVTNI